MILLIQTCERKATELMTEKNLYQNGIFEDYRNLYATEIIWDYSVYKMKPLSSTFYKESMKCTCLRWCTEAFDLKWLVSPFQNGWNRQNECTKPHSRIKGRATVLCVRYKVYPYGAGTDL